LARASQDLFVELLDVPGIDRRDARLSMPEKDARNCPKSLISGLRKPPTVVVTKPIRDRFRRQPRRLWVRLLQPLGEQFRFGANAVLNLTAIPAGAVFQFNEMH
jgi:hypothetical protein